MNNFYVIGIDSDTLINITTDGINTYLLNQVGGVVEQFSVAQTE